jgi:hypothetical protein
VLGGLCKPNREVGFLIGLFYTYLLLGFNRKMSNESQKNIEINSIILYDGIMITREQIKFGLVATGLTAKEIAEISGVSQNSIGNLLKENPAHRPNISTVKAVLDLITKSMREKGWRFTETGGIDRIPQ